MEAPPLLALPSSGATGNSIVVDALPYIDQEYDEPGMKEMVRNMIEDEKRRYRPTKNYLEHLAPLELHKFETEVMKKEFERLAQRQPMEVMSMKRYELPPPPAGKLTDLSAWSECVDNSYAQLEHQATRIANLDYMLEYSCESWKSYLEVLTRMVTQAQKQLNDVKREIQEINWQRKSGQKDAGEQLKILESSWVGLVSKNYEIERACLYLELEMATKKAEKARNAAMAVDTTPLEEIIERQHPKYVPEPSPTKEGTNEEDDSGEDPKDAGDGPQGSEGSSTEELNQTKQKEDSSGDSNGDSDGQADSPPEPPPQEINDSGEEMETD